MKKIKRAFTIVELLVSVAIITLILSVVLWNYRGFNDNLAVSSAAQEIAIAIRQAQTFGINVRESGASTNQFNYAYGIYFNRSIPNSYRIFVDINGNNSYDIGESVELVTLRNNVAISNACDATNCPPSSPAGINGINITFLRPSPDARIYYTNSSGANISGPVNSARIQLTSQNNKIVYVSIEVTGQITIQ